jgi:hypothetical protein
MTTVARTFVSIPQRFASETWDAIVALIAPDSNSAARSELSAVAGVVCSCIADEALADDPIVVYGVGPRLRVYAVYGDDAVDGEGANESALSWVPTDGDWRLSLPCPSDDLAWVQGKLAKVSKRVTARELGAAIDDEEGDRSAAVRAAESGVAVDLNSFLRR